MKTIRDIAVVLFIVAFFAYWAASFGKSISRDIQQQKVVDSLMMEKLKLEIQIKKLELQRHP